MRFHHYAMEVRNIEESITFFKNHFGLHEECRLILMEEEIVFLVSDHFRLELIATQQEKNEYHVCFEVSNLKEVINRFSHRILEGPYKLENGWETVFIKGADREIIEFLQVRSNA
ncbi:glyoxalase/bleomycin resistance/dioxygenase family protein [Bacillus sp. BRMEA1]|uniref:VOC family protein n=1 Tax=Neobacillus endophyticus TaxID=2738405 RepID=UPI0015673694|nr:glyoxalase/bleomycin resistance/dioxygenase family protein [Neobacillus endophyticus]NRD77565.1 glyoxalase/bleomycin resistance/dioxygenase family protein [Neobacillus endophyticus]